ncbi:MAG TPA: TrkA family potassium uptake protein [Micromonosporaceae bacterium]
MNIVVAGCGRVGSALAGRLASQGHKVWVIDRDPKARRLLPRNFTGEILVGNAFSRAALDAAATGHADAFVAATAGDTANIVAARTAKEVYRVPLVIALIGDPSRARVCRELGVPAVAPVRWAVERIAQMLQHRDLSPEHEFGSGETLLVRGRLPGHLTGRPLDGLEVDGEIRVVEVSRAGHSFLPFATTRAEPGDMVTFAVAAGALGRLRAFLDRELGT